jgi:hypothetical protein
VNLNEFYVIMKEITQKIFQDLRSFVLYSDGR